MTVRTRLVLTIVGISVLLAAPAIYGVSRLRELRNIAAEQAKLAEGFRRLGDLQTELAELNRYVRGHVIAPEDSTWRIAFDKAQANARDHIRGIEGSGFAAEARSATVRFDSLTAAHRHAMALADAKQKDQASVYLEGVAPAVTAAETALDSIDSAIDAVREDQITNARRIANVGLAGIAISLVVAIALVMIIGSWTTHTITTPVRRLRQAMAGVASGEFVVPENLPYGRGDEIGDLSRSFSWMTQQLERLDKMKAEFVSIATHELKNPITVISGYSELIEEGVYGNVPPQQHVALQAIREQTQVVNRLVNQLLDISRLEAGGLTLEMNEVTVEDLVRTLERSFGILAGKRNIDLDFQIAESTPTTIHADPDRLRDQVLGNLLSNALKFTQDGGRISVRVWGEDNKLHIEVTDSGVGIPRDQLPLVFDKFYQVGSQARAKGAGLGLAIAKEIIDAHHGEISVQSTENVGTTFRISLPVQQNIEPAPVTEADYLAGSRSPSSVSAERRAAPRKPASA
jgi:signal transduction histidine kinase